MASGSIRFRDPPAFADLVLEVAAGHQFHRDVKPIRTRAGREHPHHMRMAERGGDARLLLECRDPPLVGGEILAEDLERHLAVQRVVMGHENHAHAAHRVAPHQRVGAECALHPRVSRTFGHSTLVKGASSETSIGPPQAWQ
jgi:hypothetical protein